jgi:hypothetical protein
VGHAETTSRAPAAASWIDLVEHRHHVEALDRELLLAEEALCSRPRAPRPGEALEQAALLLGVERLPVGARLDGLTKPDALLVVGDVLDLVGDRAAVGLRRWGRASAKVSPGTATRSTEAGMACISSS